MQNFQKEKAVVRRLHETLSKSTADTVAQDLARHTAATWHWRGMHPFHEQHGADAVAGAFWVPFLKAMSRVQMRPDIFMAGLNEIDGYRSVWVTTMGHLLALFDRPFLSIRPNGRIVMFRFVEFDRVENGRIVETAFFCDLPHLMIQAGQDPFAPATGAHLVQPGPATHDGLLYDVQNPDTSRTTLSNINAMLSDMGERAETMPIEQRLARTWHDDMLWWGPAGIGATFTIARYVRQHAGPFRAALSKGYRFNGHICRMAEGDFGGFFGWANLTVTNAGGYLGMTASPHPADMRVVDIYRAHEGKLAENWIFIDILHYLNMQGLDVLARMQSLQEWD